MDYARLYHLNTKVNRHLPPEASWPKEWNTVYYKTYERFKKIPLAENPLHSIVSTPFLNIPLSRRSRRKFSPYNISIEELSAIFKYSCGIIRREEDGRPIRAHPSAGARYPLEYYLILPNAGTDIDAGLYHYNVRNHELEVLNQEKMEKEDILKIFTYPFIADASAHIVITSVFSRNMNKYGQRGYRQILIEAGHVGQNIENLATLLKLKTCPLSGTRDKEMEQFLDIDGVEESLVYALAIGK